MREFGKTQGELMYEAMVREARWEIIRRRIYLAVALLSALALLAIAIKLWMV